ncbi:MAG: conjugal transfer protein TrbI [Pelagibacterium sp. SCN 64-44]|nr:MAG: conjugal transfer protein TrbI [Pelagibacterium sp. SCN 64-44]
MTDALKLGEDAREAPKIRRLNRLPIIIAIVLVVTFFAVIIYGLSSRGLRFGAGDDLSTTPGSRPASSYGDQLTQGVPDGIIGEPTPMILQPVPFVPAEDAAEPVAPVVVTPTITTTQTGIEAEEVWRARLEREQEEQFLRELQRQRMASLQADGAAFDSPIAVDLQRLSATTTDSNATVIPQTTGSGLPPNALELYAAAMQAGLTGQGEKDPNGQAAKAAFFNQDLTDLGYLPNGVVAPVSPFEVKRGSVIPATLITGINSDLPGRIVAQVSQGVYDSATGRHLLIPQGSKLFGRYDSEVTFGQSRVLVIWTDIVFPDGSTLQIGGMAGADSAGYGGFTDQVDDHFFETFGSAMLVALIGAGTEMILPQEQPGTSGMSNGESAVRESFAETFSELSEQTVSRNMDVQPTLEIRPGYRFNVLVDQDMVFPRAF